MLTIDTNIVFTLAVSGSGLR